MDIVAKAIEYFEQKKYEESFELSASFNKKQQKDFLEATGFLNELDILQGRILFGAYKIDIEKDPEIRAAALKVYETLCETLARVQKKGGNTNAV